MKRDRVLLQMIKSLIPTEYAIKPTGQFSINDCTLDDIIMEIKWLQWWLWDKNVNCFNVQ